MRSWHFERRDFTDRIQLAAGLVQHWQAAEASLRPRLGELAAWLRDEHDAPDVAERIAGLGAETDAVLVFKAIHILDPERVPGFRGILLTEPRLLATVKAASSGKVAALRWLDALWSADILEHALSFPGGNHAVRRILKAWRRAFAEYRALAATFAVQGSLSPADLEPGSVDRAKLMTAAFPGPALLAAANRELDREVDELARECVWLQPLLQAARQSPAAALLALRLVPAAREAAAAARETRGRQIGELWRSCAAGAAGGALLAAVTGLLMQLPCRAGSFCRTGTGAAMAMPLAVPAGVAFLLLSAMLLLCAVHLRAVARYTTGPTQRAVATRIFVRWSALAAMAVAAVFWGLWAHAVAAMTGALGAALGAVAGAARTSMVNDRDGRVGLGPLTLPPFHWVVLVSSVTGTMFLLLLLSW